MFWWIKEKWFTRVLRLAREETVSEANDIFLQAYLRTRENYFFVIGQNNKIYCSLSFSHILPFSFHIQPLWFSYQNSSSQCMNFRRRGLVWKSVAILFSLSYKNHHLLKIQTQQRLESRTGLPRKSNCIFFVAGLSSKTPTEHATCSLISMILSNFPQNVNYCFCCYQQRQQLCLAIMTSKRSKWNHSLGEL